MLNSSIKATTHSVQVQEHHKASARVTVLSLVEGVICFSDILPCLSGSIDHLLEANRCMNGTDLHTSCLCVVVIIAVIIAVMVPVGYYTFHSKMMGFFGGKFLNFFMSQVSFCIFDNGRYRHVLLNQTFHVCLQCVSVVYAHMHVHAQQYDRTAAHRSSVQQLANPVNHNVMSIQLDILGAVSQNFHVSLLSVQRLCLRISTRRL